MSDLFPALAYMLDRRVGDRYIGQHQRLAVSLALVEQTLGSARLADREFRLMEKGRVVACGLMSGLSNEIVARYLAV